MLYQSEKLINTIHVKECLPRCSGGLYIKNVRCNNDHAPAVACMIPTCNVNRKLLATYSAHRLDYVNQNRIIEAHSCVELEYVLSVPENLGSQPAMSTDCSARRSVLSNACHWASVSFLPPGLRIVWNMSIKVASLKRIAVWISNTCSTFLKVLRPTLCSLLVPSSSASMLLVPNAIGNSKMTCEYTKRQNDRISQVARNTSFASNCTWLLEHTSCATQPHY